MTLPTHELGAEAAGRIGALLAPWANETSPGLLIAVTRGGQAVYKRCVGMADLAHGVPLSPATVVRIASQSKQFTVLLTLMMEAEGRLSLDDNVRDHCPWLPAYAQKITLRHLAANTSGLRDILDTMILGGIPILAPSSRAAARAIVARQKGVNFAPDADLLYSNSNFLLLSEILEQVSGMSFDALLRERITGPLGMHDTRLMARDDEILPRLATHHRRGADGRWLKSAWGIAIGGEGGMVSTLDDMLRWQANLRQPKVGSADMIALMEAPGATINGMPSHYGLGLVTTHHRGLRCIGHGGWIAGSRSESFRIPQEDLGIIVLSNHDDFSSYDLARRIADIALGRPHVPNLSPAAIDLLNGKAGTYRQADGSGLLRIATGTVGPLLVGSMGTMELEEISPRRFRPRGALPPYDLILSEDGGIETEKFGRRRGFVPADASAEGDGRLAGTYFDDSSGIEATIRIEEGDLRMCSRSPFGSVEVRLERCDHDLYLAHPESSEQHDAWRAAPWELPWLFSVRGTPDMIVLNSDRSAGIALRRVGGKP